MVNFPFCIFYHNKKTAMTKSESWGKCEVKWALGTITTSKASGGVEFQLSYFKS